MELSGKLNNKCTYISTYISSSYEHLSSVRARPQETGAKVWPKRTWKECDNLFMHSCIQLFVSSVFVFM